MGIIETELKERNNIKEKSKEEIDKILAYGSVGLGLNSVKKDDEANERIKEDIKG